jgi:hypothetical protein
MPPAIAPARAPSASCSAVLLPGASTDRALNSRLARCVLSCIQIQSGCVGEGRVGFWASRGH